MRPVTPLDLDIERVWLSVLQTSALTLVCLMRTATPMVRRAPALSRDGRWLAYVSNASGQQEVYVRPFPDAGSSIVQVSTTGGFRPLWARNGQELFYINSAGELVAVQFTGGSTFAAGRQDVLFSTADYLALTHQFDVSLDDQRFVMLRVEEAPSVELILVQNFFEELKERVPN